MSVSIKCRHFYFQFNRELQFLDQFSFSVVGNLDPDGLMPPGENYAVSPIQLSYSPVSMSAVYGAPLVPVSLKFKSPGEGENGLQNLYIKLIRAHKSKGIKRSAIFSESHPPTERVIYLNP